MRRWSVMTALVLAALPGTARGIPDLGVSAVGHLHWLHNDNSWLSAVGTLDANGDATPDVVVAGGDRTAGYSQCLLPPGFPGPTLHQVSDTALAPAAKLATLDGVTGEPLWEVEFGAGGLIGQRPERTHAEVIEGLHTGDLDGDGVGDLLVLRSSLALDRSEIVQRATMYDPRTGDARWNVTQTKPGEAFAFQLFQPMDVFGDPGGVLTSVAVIVEITGTGIKITFDVDARLVHLNPGGPPTTWAPLPDELGGVSIPLPYGDGYRLISFPATLEASPGGATIVVDVRATDLTLDASGRPVFEQAWFRPGAGGSPFMVTGGNDPAVVVGRDRPAEERGSIAALDLDDGIDRWINLIDAGPRGGTFTVADVNADGVEDVVASPAFGPDATGLLSGGPFAELAALDGRTGSELWRRQDPGAKFRAWALDLADVDGDGRPELAASLSPQDGFALCSQPADDLGAVGVYDLATGAKECHLVTDRFVSDLVSANLDGKAGGEVVAATLGGNTYAFTSAGPGCGLSSR